MIVICNMSTALHNMGALCYTKTSLSDIRTVLCDMGAV